LGVEKERTRLRTKERSNGKSVLKFSREINRLFKKNDGKDAGGLGRARDTGSAKQLTRPSTVEGNLIQAKRRRVIKGVMMALGEKVDHYHEGYECKMQGAKRSASEETCSKVAQRYLMLEDKRRARFTGSTRGGLKGPS